MKNAAAARRAVADIQPEDSFCPVTNEFCPILTICFKPVKRKLVAIYIWSRTMNLLLPLVAVLIWSINTIVSKLSAGSIDPAAISFYRWLLALLVLTPFCLPGVWRHRHTIKTQLWRLLVLGLLGMVLYQSLAYYAAHSVSAVMMGILGATIPLLTILLSGGTAPCADARHSDWRPAVVCRAGVAGERG